MGRDFFESYFVAIRLADGDPWPMWIGRALSDPNCNPEKPNCVLIKYFYPTSRNRVVQDFYTGWDSERGLRWKVVLVDPPI